MRKTKKKSLNQRLTKSKFEAVLADLGACSSAQDWVRRQGKVGSQRIWEACKRDDWMTWLVEKATSNNALTNKAYDAMEKVSAKLGDKIDNLYALPWSRKTNKKTNKQINALELKKERLELAAIRKAVPWEKIEASLLKLYIKPHNQ